MEAVALSKEDQCFYAMIDIEHSIIEKKFMKNYMIIIMLKARYLFYVEEQIKIKEFKEMAIENNENLEFLIFSLLEHGQTILMKMLDKLRKLTAKDFEKKLVALRTAYFMREKQLSLLDLFLFIFWF